MTDAPTVQVTRPHMRTSRMFVIAAVVVVLDQLTKHWAVTALPGEPPRHVLWTLQWNLSFNSGMAFSQAQGLGPVIGALALVVVIVLAMSVRRTGSTVAMVAGALIIGGAVGNLIDRLFRGKGWLRGSVVDFIDFQWFPIFNVADSGVTVGGILFVLWSLLSGRRQHPVPAAVPDDRADDDDGVLDDDGAR